MSNPRWVVVWMRAYRLTSQEQTFIVTTTKKTLDKAYGLSVALTS